MLLPDSLSPSVPQHAVEVTTTGGPWGGLTRRYRGARIEANAQDAVFGLFLEGHPMHGKTGFGTWENLLPLVDAWIEGRDAPPPYSWSRP